MRVLLLCILPTLAYEDPAPPKPLYLGPSDVLVVANSKMPESLEVARYYLEKRKVPEAQLIKLPLPTGEDISRADYEALLRDKLRAEVRARRPNAKVILLVYGVPLRIAASSPSAADNRRADDLRKEKEPLVREVEQARVTLQTASQEPANEPLADSARSKAAAERQLRTLEGRLRALEDQLIALSHVDSLASVDSELALLAWGNYPLARWQLNPLNWRVPAARRSQAPPVLMVARIDAPTVPLCKRLIDDAIEVEERGLEGEMWVDSRAIMYKPAEDATGTGYGGYDESLRELYRLVRDHTKYPANIDVKPELFPEKACKNTGLYCGWYSHAQFVDCCIFRKGAVAVHIASSEAVSLRDPKCAYWCKNLIERGACATMGPVAEPFLFAFPRPAEFFGFLLTGQYTLAECYYYTLAVNSWRMVLVGDPLYRPFAKKPMLAPERIKPSPAGAKSPFGS